MLLVSIYYPCCGTMLMKTKMWEPLELATQAEH